MQARPLAVDGALAFTADVYPDHRGHILSHFDAEAFREAAGHPFFPVAQSCWSRSRKGVVRGIHHTATPPGMAKYVHCSGGGVLDFVVDLRIGSPTFGAVDSVVLDQSDHVALYLPTGVGHGYLALTDDAVVTYQLSSAYSADTEYAISPLDPALGLPLGDVDPVLSDRDRAGRTLAEAQDAGLLPDHETCRAIDRALPSRAGVTAGRV